MLRWIVLIGLFFAAPAAAQETVEAEIVKLWPGAPSGSGRPEGSEKIGSKGSAEGAVTNVIEPRMEIYRPAKPNGAAALVIGGGGYFRIQIGSAARPVARYLLARGVTVAVLYYRLPGDGWNADAPFQDGQRAMRLLRADAKRLGIDPKRVGAIGSSAGGHLAGILATRGAHDFYPRIDAADAQPATPDYAGLIYPVISMRPPIDTTRTKRELDELPDFLNAYSVEAQVTTATPPVFLAHAADDPIAHVDHSMRMFAAMRAAKRPVELHIFAKGGHSWGIGAKGSAVAEWPRLLANWAKETGWF